MSTRLKVTILGGSALATPGIFEAMARRETRCAYDFVLFGRDTERLELVHRVSEQIAGAAPGLDLRITTTTVLEEAVEGADYCINQVRIGGLEGRAFDETFPRQFGIPGEETVGPGGFSSSLRGIPAVLEICRVIERAAPDVVMLNLTNPSSIIQYAIRRYSSVNVIGTCDSPVHLMETIARLLGAPLEELVFESAGMHHFGWVTGVRRGEQQLLPELLERAGELEKLGTDPVLIRILGAIPSSYGKYYFHPDRILAQTEGKPVRARQLMDLTARMLEDYRRWQPGQPADMLSQRGAAWYEKIVVPTLLALAEKQTVELVLSVDNNGTLPWLPDSAIIEAPVSIQDGRVAAVRSARLPQNLQAMLAQNCAYEMLAAQAIAEKDRDKAVQALLSNLLVSTYDQVEGILNLIWPH